MKRRWIPWTLGALAGMILAVGLVILWPRIVEYRCILRLTSADDEEVRRAAAELARTGSPRAILPIFNAIAQAGGEREERPSDSGRVGVLVSALQDILQRVRGAKWGSALVDLLRDERQSEHSRAAVFQALRASGEEIHGEILLEVLRRRLSEPPSVVENGAVDQGQVIDRIGAILGDFPREPSRNAVALFDLVLADASGDAYRNRWNLLRSLGFHWLWRHREKNDGFRALDDVFPRLALPDGKPGVARLAEALCRIVDRDCLAAVKILRTLDGKLATPGAPGSGSMLSDEQRTLSWYIAVGTALAGATGEHLLERDVQQSMRVFFAQNADRPEYAARCVMHVVQTLHDSRDTAKNAQKSLMGGLTERFTLWPDYTANVPLDLFRHVVDMYMQTCPYSSTGRGPYIRALVEEFDPKSLPCVSALAVQAWIRWSEEKDLAGAEAAFERILRDRVGGPWPRLAKAHLVSLWLMANRPKPEIGEYVEDLKKAPREEYELFRYGRIIRDYENSLGRQGARGRFR